MKLPSVRLVGFAVLVLTLTSAVSAQLVTLTGSVIEVSPGMSAALSLGDPVSLQVNLTQPLPIYFDGTPEGVIYNNSLSLSVGKLSFASQSDAWGDSISALVVGDTHFDPSFGPLWGLNLDGMVPTNSGSTLYEISGALLSSHDVGNSLTAFPAGIPITDFDYQSSGSVTTWVFQNGAWGPTDYAVYQFDGYTTVPVPESSNCGVVAVALLVGLAIRRRMRRS